MAAPHAVDMSSNLITLVLVFLTPPDFGVRWVSNATQVPPIHGSFASFEAHECSVWVHEYDFSMFLVFKGLLKQ